MCIVLRPGRLETNSPLSFLSVSSNKYLSIEVCYISVAPTPLKPIDVHREGSIVLSILSRMMEITA